MEDVDGVQVLQPSADVHPQLGDVGEGQVDLVYVEQLMRREIDICECHNLSRGA